MSAIATKIEGWRWEMQSPGAGLTRTRVEHFEPRADEAVVAVAGCGVGHTDLGFLYGGVRTRKAPPLAPGHEVAGEAGAGGGRYPQPSGNAVVRPPGTPRAQSAA